jgi:two-component system, NtrC family, sensor histidine kinase KinB
MAVVMSLTVTGYFGVERAIDLVLAQNLPTVVAAHDLDSSLHEQQTAFAQLAAGDLIGAPTSYDHSNTSLDSALQKIVSSVTETQEKQLAARLVVDLARYRSIANKVMNANRFSPQPGVVEIVRLNLAPELAEIRSVASQIAELNEAAIVEGNATAHQSAQDAAMRSIGAIAIGLVVAILLAFRLVRVALTPLAMLAKQADSIVDGDVGRAFRLPRKDEIGALADSFHAMATKLVDLRRSEVRKLQRIQRMSDAALDSLYDPVIVTDTKQRIVNLNRAAATIFGSVPASPRKAAYDHFTEPRILRAIESAAEERVSNEEDEKGLVQLTVDGQVKTFRLRATPMRDDEDQRIGGVVVLEDVTKMKELDQLKTEFIGVAAHELRTPVASLLLSADLMLEGAVGDLSSDQQELVETQREDLTRLERLINDLLDTAKIGAKELHPQRELIPAAKLIKGPLPALKAIAVEARVALTIEVPKDLPAVNVDPTMIGRVITNLVTNAVRHTPSGGSVTILGLTKGNFVEFEIRDTGAGIPAEYLSRIFERFVQVPGATGGGAGLGLPIAKALVEAHGGTLNVTSHVGIGSIFGFTLPLAPMSQEGNV